MRYLLQRLARDLRAAPWALVINSVASSPAIPAIVRVAIFRAAGIGCHWHSDVGPGCWIRAKQLRIGANSTVNRGCVFDNRVNVDIGDRCGIGLGVQFVTSSHELDDPAVRAGRGTLAPISVGNGVWIGSGAVILQGVSIGDGCVIAAGAIVRGDCEPHCLYGGVPARRIKQLPGSESAES